MPSQTLPSSFHSPNSPLPVSSSESTLIFGGPLVAPIARSQEIFAKVYAPKADIVTPGYSHYRAANFDSARQVDAAFKLDLALRYTGLTFEEVSLRIGLNALAAFPGDYNSIA